MKKIIVLALLLLCFGILAHANPIMTAFFSEIYFDDNDEWTIELYDYYQGGIYTLDDCYIESTTNMAFFNNGITFTPNDTLVVTNADMQTDLTINREGDYLVMGDYAYDEICWGNYSNHINAPYPGQSLVRVVPYYDYFLLAKENQPSLGYNPFDAQTFGGIQGDVSGGGGYPVQGAQVNIISPIYFTVYVDEVGYFYIDGLYGMNYTLSAYKDGYTSNEITVTVEPDSISGVSFLLVPQSTNPDSQSNTVMISNYPNPFYDETEIHFSLPHQYTTGTMTIFNSKGQKIKEIPVSPTENSVKWSGFDENNAKVPSGVYFYNLESEDKTLASGKMLYLR